MPKRHEGQSSGLSIVDIVQGNTYVQRYQRRLSTQSSSAKLGRHTHCSSAGSKASVNCGHNNSRQHNRQPHSNVPFADIKNCLPRASSPSQLPPTGNAAVQFLNQPQAFTNASSAAQSSPDQIQHVRHAQQAATAGSSLQPQRLRFDPAVSPALQPTPNLQPSVSPQVPDINNCSSTSPCAEDSSSVMVKAAPTMQQQQQQQQHVQIAVQSDMSMLTSFPALVSTSGRAVSSVQHQIQRQHMQTATETETPTLTNSPPSISAKTMVQQQREQQLQQHQPVEVPVLKRLVQSSGAGCGDVLELAATKAPSSLRRDSWVTRSFKGLAESTCTLKLLPEHPTHIDIKVTFDSAASTPQQVTFAQTGSLAQAWQQVGSVQLHRQQGQQLQHVFRLAGQGGLKTFLRITFSGLLCAPVAGLHCVRHMSITAPARAACQGLQASMCTAIQPLLAQQQRQRRQQHAQRDPQYHHCQHRQQQQQQAQCNNQQQQQQVQQQQRQVQQQQQVQCNALTQQQHQQTSCTLATAVTTCAGLVGMHNTPALTPYVSRGCTLASTAVSTAASTAGSTASNAAGQSFTGADAESDEWGRSSSRLRLELESGASSSLDTAAFAADEVGSESSVAMQTSPNIQGTVQEQSDVCLSRGLRLHVNTEVDSSSGMLQGPRLQAAESAAGMHSQKGLTQAMMEETIQMPSPARQDRIPEVQAVLVEALFGSESSFTSECSAQEEVDLVETTQVKYESLHAIPTNPEAAWSNNLQEQGKLQQLSDVLRALEDSPLPQSQSSDSSRLSGSPPASTAEQSSYHPSCSRDQPFITHAQTEDHLRSMPQQHDSGADSSPPLVAASTVSGTADLLKLGFQHTQKQLQQWQQGHKDRITHAFSECNKPCAGASAGHVQPVVSSCSQQPVMSSCSQLQPHQSEVNSHSPSAKPSCIASADNDSSLPQQQSANSRKHLHVLSSLVMNAFFHQQAGRPWSAANTTAEQAAHVLPTVNELDAPAVQVPDPFAAVGRQQAAADPSHNITELGALPGQMSNLFAAPEGQQVAARPLPLASEFDAPALQASDPLLLAADSSGTLQERWDASADSKEHSRDGHQACNPHAASSWPCVGSQQPDCAIQLPQAHISLPQMTHVMLAQTCADHIPGCSLQVPYGHFGSQESSMQAGSEKQPANRPKKAASQTVTASNSNPSQPVQRTAEPAAAADEGSRLCQDRVNSTSKQHKALAPSQQQQQELQPATELSAQCQAHANVHDHQQPSSIAASYSKTASGGQADRQPASVQLVGWPAGNASVHTLRHGSALRKAAFEAAATAAALAVKADAGQQTPPCIAFDSKAAKRALAAVQAANAAASVTALAGDTGLKYDPSSSSTGGCSSAAPHGEGLEHSIEPQQQQQQQHQQQQDGDSSSVQQCAELPESDASAKQHSEACRQHQSDSRDALRQALMPMQSQQQQQQQSRHVHWQDQIHDSQQAGKLQSCPSFKQHNSAAGDPFKASLSCPVLMDLPDACCHPRSNPGCSQASSDMMSTDERVQTTDTDSTRRVTLAVDMLQLGTGRLCKQTNSIAGTGNIALQNLRRQQAAQRKRTRGQDATVKAKAGSLERPTAANPQCIPTADAKCPTAKTPKYATVASLACAAADLRYQTPVRGGMLGSLSEQDFWDAARADLIDTVEAAKQPLHARGVLSPAKMATPAAGWSNSKAADLRHVGITPLIGIKRATQLSCLSPFVDENMEALGAEWGL